MHRNEEAFSSVADAELSLVDRMVESANEPPDLRPTDDGEDGGVDSIESNDEVTGDLPQPFECAEDLFDCALASR